MAGSMIQLSGWVWEAAPPMAVTQEDVISKKANGFFDIMGIGILSGTVKW